MNSTFLPSSHQIWIAKYKDFYSIRESLDAINKKYFPRKILYFYTILYVLPFRYSIVCVVFFIPALRKFHSLIIKSA